MKKMILSAAIMFSCIGFAAAQTAATQPAVTTKVTVQPLPVTKPVQAIKPVKQSAKPLVTEGVVLKKDGTPDKRYSKTAVKDVPLKKDGTPDQRFKANKKN